MTDTKAFAVYRLPFQTQCTLVEQLGDSPLTLPSCAELCGHQGFVMAPFVPSVAQPILILRPDRITTMLPDALPTERLRIWRKEGQFEASSPDDYHVDFANFHEHLVDGDFRKLVLSRQLDVALDDAVSPFTLFAEACRCYPRVMVALVSTPQAGTWLAATPEILLAGSDSQWQTVALAGTMPYEDGARWSDKNIQEQRYVATYITEVLEHFATDFTEEGPHTVRAAHLAHLRSDFHFMMMQTEQVGELLQALHPTPAVCGLPKHAAQQFIVSNEHRQRSYYSGFLGPLFLQQQTHLYVTLRCMQLLTHHARLYAGGGILRDSREQQEWQETEIKLDTMRRLLQTDHRD